MLQGTAVLSRRQAVMIVPLMSDAEGPGAKLNVSLPTLSTRIGGLY